MTNPYFTNLLFKLKETVGVCVASYDSNGEFPAFYTKQSGYKSVCNVTSPCEAAGLLEQCQNTGSGVLLAVPILEERIKSKYILYYKHFHKKIGYNNTI